MQAVFSDADMHALFAHFDEAPAGLGAQVDGSGPVTVHELFASNDLAVSDEEELQPTLTHDRLFLAEDFQELNELILEGTVFNVVSEAVYQESDLLSIGKTYVRMKPSIE